MHRTAVGRVLRHRRNAPERMHEASRAEEREGNRRDIQGSIRGGEAQRDSAKECGESQGQQGNRAVVKRGRLEDCLPKPPVAQKVQQECQADAQHSRENSAG